MTTKNSKTKTPGRFKLDDRTYTVSALILILAIAATFVMWCYSDVEAATTHVTLPAPTIPQTQDETLTQEPDFVPGTHVAWPRHDKACDEAFTQNAAAVAVEACTISLREYQTTIEAMVDVPELPQGAIAEMVFNEAYTNLELAESYKLRAQRGDDALAEKAARTCDALAHTLLDPIANKFVRDETESEAQAAHLYRQLLDRIHAAFPDVAGGDGKSSG
jgi:hypothetical protein